MPSAFFLPFRVAENKKRKKATHVGALCLPQQCVAFYVYCMFLRCLQCVDNGADVSENAVELAQTLNVVMDALLLVPLDKRSCVVGIYVKTLLDGLGVVVRTSAFLSAFDEALHQLILRHVELNHRRHCFQGPPAQ